MKRVFLFLGMVLMHAAAAAQSQEDVEKIMLLLGYDSPEEVDGNEVERLSEYLEAPLELNVERYPSLVASGILTQYQAASVADYIKNHGYIYTLNELAAVDGFNDSLVKILAPFISFATLMYDPSRRVEQDIAAKSGAKAAGAEPQYAYGLKYRLAVGNGLSASMAFSSPYSGSPGRPSAYSFNLSYAFRRVPLTLHAGDFNLRFGQGLALWSGMSMGGLAAPSSFYRTSSGISDVWSFTGGTSYTGVALYMVAGRVTASMAAAVPGIKTAAADPDGISLLPAFNLAWNGRNTHVSCTHYMEFGGVTLPGMLYIPDMKTAADIALCVEGNDLFAEASYDWVNSSAAMLCGGIFPLGEHVRLAAHLRYYPSSYDGKRSGAPRSGTKCSNEYGASLSAQYSGTDRLLARLSVDGAYFPEEKQPGIPSILVKPQLVLEYSPSEACLLRFRIAERYRTWGQRFRTDVRADLQWSWNSWSLMSRLNLLQCISLAGLGYVEGGYKGAELSVYLRQGLFVVDEWDDRIYAYERDAPGNYSVPAYYGRGIWTAVMAAWRFSRWGRIYARLSMISYPFMSGEKKKPGRAELKLQCVFSF